MKKGDDAPQTAMFSGTFRSAETGEVLIGATNDIFAPDRSPASLSPSNPNSKLSNGFLGYFSAYAIDSRTIVLP